MKVEIITIGDEIMSGDIVDTNFSWLAERLWHAGYDLHWHSSVADRPDKMSGVFRTALRSDIVIVTGGLGPTSDDRTLEVAAETFGLKMIEDATALEEIEQRLKALGRESNPSQRKQALHPEGSVVFPNVTGTAPGCLLKIEGTQFIFLVGVPSEMHEQWERDVGPFLNSLGERPHRYAQRIFRCFGPPEAELQEKLKDLALDQVRLSFRIRFPEILIKIAAWRENVAEVEQSLDEVERAIRDRIGRHIYATGDNLIEKIIGELLTQRSETLAIAESCTGGYLGNLITDVSGSSDYFDRGLITYSDQSKKELLDVKAETLEAHGAVSEAVAREMAEGVRERSRSTYGIGITGIAGPTGGSEEKPVGTVHVALATPDETLHKKYHFPFLRLYFKQVAAHAALHKLRRYISGLT
jgi:nicotinamide-nucleotide amidase